jgi:diadenosine tetraphosphate (Ap4A) HIT family hydrolase
MADCLPCRLENAAPDAVVYRDDTWACEIVDGYDVPGWYFLRLRRHAEGWAGLSPEEAGSFGVVSQRITQTIQKATGAPTVYFMSFGENYPHFHFLVIARPEGLAAESRGAAILATRAESLDRVAALAVAADVRTSLNDD